MQLYWYARITVTAAVALICSALWFCFNLNALITDIITNQFNTPQVILTLISLVLTGLLYPTVRQLDAKADRILEEQINANSTNRETEKNN